MTWRRSRNDEQEPTGQASGDPRPRPDLGAEFARRYEEDRIAMEMWAADLAAREAHVEELEQRIHELEDAIEADDDNWRRQVSALEAQVQDEQEANEQHRITITDLVSQLASEHAELEQARSEITRLGSGAASEFDELRTRVRNLEVALPAQQEAPRKYGLREEVGARLASLSAHRRAR